ncbi:MAG: glucoamylase family protein [Kiritimatiellae bacterium]|nr:glucoamylase family protein [Kiritimatiellia bacterium]
MQPLSLRWHIWKARQARSRASEPTLRTELFSDEQLRRHAITLAGQHRINPKRGSNRLLLRLVDNEQVLVQAYDLVTRSEADGRHAGPAGEWLLDNFYLIEQQIRLTRLHLPRTYSRELPRLLTGASAGFPRVYDIALELISHVDGRIDAENVSHFVAAYQSVTPLTLGELWAVPIMLRLGLIENLRRVSVHIARRWRDRNLAGRWAGRLLAVAEKDSATVLRVMAEMAQSDPPFNNQFVEEFCGRLQGGSPSLATVLSWVEHRLAEQGMTRDQLQRADNQTQAADQVSIGSSIGSLRFLSAMDWRKFVESASIIEQVLHTDPAGVYAAMDFITRDRYRRCVEALSRRSGKAEDAVARAAIQLAVDASRREGPPAREAHVGFYLIDKGRPHLERAIGIRPSLCQTLARTLRRHPLFCYICSLLIVTAAAASLVLAPASLVGWHDWRVWLLTGLAVIGASHLAVALVNVLATIAIGPHLVPRLDFSKGIPSSERTIVVIPSLLTSPQAVADLLEDLEIRYLANRDPNIYFALLTDFRDATEPVQTDDADLLQRARNGIQSLNARYSPEGQTVFQLFHRSRAWNPHERLWMGYERKRGKLEQFNALLRGGERSPFSEILCDTAILSTIRYVLTLDSDTGLPRDAARTLIGTMAHPLNRPRLDAQTGRVVEGYAILQPRTPISLIAANRSLFARLMAGDAGIDPYTHEVSDVYQDVFDEGSYTGKGLYDVDAFRRATAGRFPENLILSHDLLESTYARSALVADVELYEDHPANFAADMSRNHRWIRGDWQIAGWLLPRVPGPSGRRVPTILTALGWWKIFDNLRRSLVPPALWLLLLGGWIIAPQPAGFWTLFVLLLFLLPLLLAALLDMVRKPRERTWGLHLHTALKSLGRQAAEAGLRLSTLPYRAVITLDAIFVSGVRMLFTRRGLLLWYTPRYEARNACTTLADFVREMWVAPVFAVAGLAGLAVTHPGELAFSGPLLLMWLVSPAVGWWISRPLVTDPPALSAAQQTFLRGLSRQTWRYFEDLVNAEEHWLPPDNVQEVPAPMVASRTSPTNIGMALLANLAASDFGYLGIGQLIDRTDKTLATMERLERYRGHLYNWYDTRTLKPLRPMYVSTVDSGNLAGALFILRTGLLELKNQPVVSPRLLAGLQDTLDKVSSPAIGQLREKLRAPAPPTVAAALTLLEALSHEIAALPIHGSAEQRGWMQAFIRQCDAMRDDVHGLVPEPQQFDHVPTLQEAAGALAPSDRAAEYIRQIDLLARRCSEQAAMDFAFLYDPTRDLLSIGYNVTDRRRDPSYYDLLASEARVTSFMLVAQDQLPQDHWFALGRQLTTHEGALALVSWSGSMFEYLMPLLVMPTYEHTLLDQTYQAIVSRQVEYGRQRGVPWGISESCYATTDAQGAYQYGAFGIPGLGFKRGLADDLVVAPYASVLALMVAPREACRNLEKLSENGYHGLYGLYEAIDFTPARVPRGKTCVPLRSYMAHHQGMSLLALAYRLLDRPMQRRFLADPWFKASELLLCERIPRAASSLQPHTAEVNVARRPPAAAAAATLRVFPSPHTPIPEVHLLSNGSYQVMATQAGGGYSRWKDLTVTRWREDAACDGWGTFCYLRDEATGALWSSAYQPTRRIARKYEAIFAQGRAEYRRRDEDIDAHTEIAVSPEDDVEVRRITLTNLSSRTRTIEVTSYAEVVIAPLTADLAHPAFSNLFVQTEILYPAQAILCTRRPRASGENPPWMFHLMSTPGTPAGEISYETDRSAFIGRCRSVVHPAAFDKVAPLSNTDGTVLDPIVAIRKSLAIEPDASAEWHIISGMAETRAGALELIAKYRDPGIAARAFEMAWSHSDLVLRQLQVTEAEAQVYAQLASSVIHANPFHRASTGILTRNRLNQSGLWTFGISGDLPIVLMRIADVHRIDLVKQMLQAHAYWREKGLTVDLVILNEDFSGYRQVLQDRILGLIAASTEAQRVDKPGGIFLRRSEQLSEEERVLLQTVARVILTDSAETLAEQVERQTPVERKVPRFIATRAMLPAEKTVPNKRECIFFNGLGGFTSDGREYVISLAPGQTTPAPWANVLANPQIGTVITESGSAYTWVDNAHEFRLTPWHNDPVGDPSGEAFYLRDEETGQFWSPTPLPARAPGTYICRHGFGYSVFELTHLGISSELWTYVALDAPVKLAVIKVRNGSGRTRRLSATGYWEWVLGQWRHSNLMHIVTEIDPTTGALFARNVYNREFAGKTVFVNVSDAQRTMTGNRTEFLGRNGTPASPAAMRQAQLSGQTGASFDPCAALQVTFDLDGGQERELVFVLGAGNSVEEAHQLVRRFSGPASARLALENVWDFWKRTLGVVYAETPDPALNLLVNGWLEYQTLVGRTWGRSGYYQSGGAYGFRDQLQDTSALLHAAPWVAREHVLRCAGRQFGEGDVQHWWHPSSGRGVRTHCSDDFIWLPYATCRYVKTTGDTGVLDERVPFLEGRPVNADEEAYYDLPQRSGEDGTLYEHCVRAIKHGLRFGAHGLPLIGSGDWNDGMNLVGKKGRGESVWLAFLLYDVLHQFVELARSRGETEFADYCAAQAAQLRQAIEEHGWDGDWYRRAYFDDGTPLGSATNKECAIDSIAQSWAVLSGAADPVRARLAMERVDQRLVRRNAQLIQLFDPPFDKSALEPGYIKGYAPGVRENGGQYTHGAIWAVMAFAELGEIERAWELFELLNPIRHAMNPSQVNRYKVEPYVVAADIYAVAPHTGRGGWSWYTGSAGWMYRLIVETLLGLRLEMDHLRVSPRLPRDWESFKLHYRYRETFYHISVNRVGTDAAQPPAMIVDGHEQPLAAIALVDDHHEHTVEIKVPGSRG